MSCSKPNERYQISWGSQSAEAAKKGNCLFASRDGAVCRPLGQKIHEFFSLLSCAKYKYDEMAVSLSTWHTFFSFLKEQENAIYFSFSCFASFFFWQLN